MIEPQSAHEGASACVWNETFVAPRFIVMPELPPFPLAFPLPLPVPWPLACPLVAMTARSSRAADDARSAGSAASVAAAAIAPSAEEGPSAIDEALMDEPIASGSAAVEPDKVAEPDLPVVEDDGHANGHGNGHANGSAGGSALTLNLGGTKVSFQAQADAPSCAECGSILVRNGSCYKCLNCGSTSGCS